MASIRMFRETVLILQHCLKVKPGDQVLILYDETISESLEDVFIKEVCSVISGENYWKTGGSIKQLEIEGMDIGGKDHVPQHLLIYSALSKEK